MIIRNLILLFVLLSSCASAQAQAPLKLVVSVAPQKYLLERLVDPQSVVTVMVDPGQSPTTWEPSPRKMAQLAQSDILFSIGVPFELVWLPRLKTLFPQLVIADSCAGMELRALARHHHDDNNSAHRADHDASHEVEQTENALDPHVWLDPLLDIQMAENMAAVLCRHDPAHCNEYQQRLQQLRSEFLDLHQRIRQLLAPYANGRFMVFHPSWGYFAARYQLQQLAIELDGKEPSGLRLAEIIQQARTERIRAIFVQQQFSRKAATSIARQLDIEVMTLDPLREDLAAGLWSTAQKLTTALEKQWPPSSR